MLALGFCVRPRSHAMSSSKQKRQKLKLTRTDRKAELERVELLVGLKKGTIIRLTGRRFSRAA